VIMIVYSLAGTELTRAPCDTRQLFKIGKQKN
jgi:hypothetical protein